MAVILVDLLAQRGWDADSFGQRIGVSPSEFARIAGGETPLDAVGVGTFIKMARELGMSAEELYRRRAEPDNDPQA